MAAAVNDRKPGTPPLMFDIGLEYYIAARSAWYHTYNQIAGNLLHHGFEMMLRGLLFARSKHMPDALRQHRPNHDLLWFWSESQSLLGFEGTRFDGFIEDLHRWEMVRFGDFPEGKSKSLEIVVFRAAANVPRAQWLDTYRICIEDADELFMLLSREMAWPAHYTRKRIGEAAMEDYVRDNNYAIGPDRSGQ